MHNCLTTPYFRWYISRKWFRQLRLVFPRRSPAASKHPSPTPHKYPAAKPQHPLPQHPLPQQADPTLPVQPTVMARPPDFAGIQKQHLHIHHLVVTFPNILSASGPTTGEYLGRMSISATGYRNQCGQTNKTHFKRFTTFNEHYI